MHGATGYGRYKLGGLKVLVVRSCKLPVALRGDFGDVILAVRWCPGKLAGHGGLGCQTAAQEARRNGVATRQKHYADFGLGDMCANSDGKRDMF